MRGILAIMMAVGGTALISYVFITLCSRTAAGQATPRAIAPPGQL
jgi:hypothetical protein